MPLRYVKTVDSDEDFLKFVQSYVARTEQQVRFENDNLTLSIKMRCGNTTLAFPLSMVRARKIGRFDGFDSTAGRDAIARAISERHCLRVARQPYCFCGTDVCVVAEVLHS